MRFLKQILLCLCLLGGWQTLNAQHVEYGVTLDTNYMMIGDQQNLTLKVKIDPGVQIVFPHLQDTVVNGLEIISGPVRDSVKEKDGRWLLEEKYVVTAFDTGVYVVPSLPITIKSEEYDNIVRTDPVGVVVNTFEIDPQKGNYDIVMPYAAPWTFAEILPYLLWVLLGIAVLLLAWLYWDRRRKNKPLFTPKKEEIPPYVLAIRALDELKGNKMWQLGKEKEYYTRLTDTVRQYLDGELSIPAMEQTSTEILQALANCREVESKDRERIAEMLTTADFVKFAKFTPLQDESARYLEVAYDFVNNTHQRLEAELAEQRRLEEEKKRREEEEKKQQEAHEQEQTPEAVKDK